jgi:hypothetical protein
MSALFSKSVDHSSVQLWRFNGDQTAFVNGDFQEFYSIILRGEAVRFNANVYVMSGEVRATVASSLNSEWIFKCASNDEEFTVFCLNEPTDADTEFLDMLLRIYFNERSKN